MDPRDKNIASDNFWTSKQTWPCSPTVTDGSTSFSMTNVYGPEPVISLSIKSKGIETPNFSRALYRFQKESTFKVHIDHESKETIIPGTGELHLEIYIERMRGEYSTDCVTGKPRVASREAITHAYTHKKQTGDAGHYAKVVGYIEPMEPDPDPETGKDVPFDDVGIDAFHAVDSSQPAFRLATIGAFREAFKMAKSVILEPIMNVEVVAPVEFQTLITFGDSRSSYWLSTRRGTIVDSEVRDD
ncbi:uncharacterized protein LACBIDRAFT_332397 [Laccaria bicolor S238N-H82]|uniref:Predicted protein n=1 Tax=Laccaria bicolor (strain S238N-H82 / ATCC MYA-4686) TaxID=486041 RepID=B0DSL1_LACBS|nr:uncharacterized protein LACBIDRAFT_332397 [Laccaria bicolor S238N-H82]EDR02491.1 predicted protein [Laccaria bicolor S238N-H82]|eukprot:XP_001886854.1 predicted protein [Laccaria bicolor S238N-H82]